MKFIHTSDWHIGKNLEGHSRLEEQEKFCNDFIEIVEKNDNGISILNVSNNKTNMYTLEGVTKEIYCYDNKENKCKSKVGCLVIIAGIIFAAFGIVCTSVSSSTSNIEPPSIL